MVTYYKSCRIVDCKPKWIVIDEDYNKIISPTSEQIKLSVIGDPPKRCCICRSTDTYIYPDGYSQWNAHKCDKYNCTRYICNKCRSKEYYRDIVKFDPNSSDNWKKSVRKFRNKQIDPKSETGKGFIGEMIVAKTRGLKNCNLELDNFNAVFDLSVDSFYGRIQVKTASLINGKWEFGLSYNQEYDTIFLICMGKYWKNVERVYAIPWEKCVNIRNIAIYDRTPGGSQWDKFRVGEEQYEDTYQDMKLENCPVLKNSKKTKED